MEDYAAYSVIILINLLHCFMGERERGRGRDRERGGKREGEREGERERGRERGGREKERERGETEGRSTYTYRGYVSSLRVEKGKLD